MLEYRVYTRDKGHLEDGDHYHCCTKLSQSQIAGARVRIPGRTTAPPSLPRSSSEAEDQVQLALSMAWYHHFSVDERSRCSSSNTDIHESYTDADVTAKGVPGIIKREPNDRKNKGR